MERISVKEYAKSRGVSPEIVRRQLIRYADDLKGHLSPLGKSKLLDEEAVRILDSHRLQRTVTVELADPETQRAMDELRKTIEDLRKQLDSTKDMVIDLQRENTSLIKESARYQGMIEEKERNQKSQEQRISDQEQRITSQEQKITNQEQKITELQTEVNSFQRSIFGLYRKKK